MQVRCMKQGTQSWCSRTTQGDGVGREVEGVVFRMGAHLHPWLSHVRGWQGPPQCCEVTILQLKKKNPAANARDSVNPWVRKISWSGKWQPTLVFLPGEFHGRRSLPGYSLWGCKESDMTEHACTGYLWASLGAPW